jgi:hypothetical protein
MLVSALVWLVAGIAVKRAGMNAAVWTLLVGGALIHPVTVLALPTRMFTQHFSAGAR